MPHDMSRANFLNSVYSGLMYLFTLTISALKKDTLTNYGKLVVSSYENKEAVIVRI